MQAPVELAQEKMRAAGVGATAIETFTHYYQLLREGTTGLIAESEIEALTRAIRLSELVLDEQQAAAALAKTVVIKLNGGLGTSMGLDGPKTLLPVREGLNFLDVTVRQVLAAREQYGVRLPLLLMNSFATRAASLQALAKYPQLKVDGLDLDFQQSQEPKLLASDFTPVSWPKDPSLEWCPPGHGDIYPSLRDCGILDLLIDNGFEFAAVSNADNLGASPSAELAGWFAGTGASFALEVCRRTINDRKGGHLARRVRDGRLILREVAQTADDDRKFFADEQRHPFFNTNNLWLNLRALRAALDERDGVLGLPMIKNSKTVDPTDPASPKVIQIETAMGAAIEVFDDAQVIEVERDRFVPVKKTNELLLLRSDAFSLDEHTAKLVTQVETIPGVDLDPAFYQFVADFEARLPHPISLRQASSLRVRGDVTFGRDIVVVGNADIEADGPEVLADGTVVGNK